MPVTRSATENSSVAGDGGLSVSRRYTEAGVHPFDMVEWEIRDGVGELALGGLARLDRVAAVMFASVYRSIEDLSAFEAELRRLESEPVAGPDQLEIEVLQDEAVPSAQESILATPSGGRSKARRSPRNKQRRGHASHP